MATPELAAIEQRLLSHLQRDFPLVPCPYQELGRELGVSESDVIALITTLRDKGLVRQISPVVDARRLGYQSTLVAAEVPVHRLRGAETVLAEHPRISHAYERDNELNVWFTLSTDEAADVDEEVGRVGIEIGAAQAFSLPALRLFKIGAFFGAASGGEESIGNSGREMPQKVELSFEEKKVINVLQQDLPLTSSPFGQMSQEAGMTTAGFLFLCQALIDRGVIRRFAASVNHRKAGYEGNGMACWRVPHKLVESLGQQLAAIEAVSHCYERRTNPAWQHNLFAMFHGGTPEACRLLVKDAAEKLGVSDYLLLFSIREIRKTRVKYLA
jgi:DNA-binding Lrp family transcriptional regulator